MSHRIFLKSKPGLRVERLSENLWSAQSKVHNLFITPKIEFSVDVKNQIKIKKYDVLKPALIYSILFAAIFLILDFLSESSLANGLGYLILGSSIFYFGIMSLLIFIVKVRIQKQLNNKS
ncbi:hypothetical protein [Aequorivita echinoideorum]|uniref:Uncharacterized protein n=1 Tax=Aequorivita echinoideorum TaxID=1549647 RepID=A0ABS5S2Z5_9FLAO|nr:hypothetical protein [Aequorivita echinoideorum]MBT0606777.1 hypothetical protein [Aequorivita echinoideorum]